MKDSKKDPTLQALQTLEKANQAFEKHWLWEQLHCTPKEFFISFQKQLSEKLLQSSQWKEALSQAHDRLIVQVKDLRPPRPPSAPLIQSYGAIPV